MRVRKLEIKHFRGIKELEWLIPYDRKLLCLIGAGDGGKSTILEALNWLLSDKWNLAVADTDFFNGDTIEELVIRAALVDLPESVIGDLSLGFNQSGIDDEGKLHQDPEDDMEPCLYIELRVDDSLEPKWTVLRVDGSSSPLSATQRRKFATFKVDDRVDIHFRWTRTSALGRLSLSDGSARSAMAIASRAARDAINSHRDTALDELTTLVQERMNTVGGGTFADVHPGLDTSLSATSGNLSLYEGSIPLSNYGLGTKRLTGMAIQQLAAGEKSVLIIDEIEHGLEPHRLVRTLQLLTSDPRYDQVFITTHSSVAIEQAETDNLVIIRNSAGTVSATALPDGTGAALGLRRSRPSSFLAQRIIVCEGKTEHGFMEAVIDHWDRLRKESGLPIAAGEGTVIQDGEGGSKAPARASELVKLGYEVALLLDNDDRSVDKHVKKAASLGVPVYRWSEGNWIEREVVFGLGEDQLSEFLQLATRIRSGGEHTVLDDLHSNELPSELSGLDVLAWTKAGACLENCRAWIALAAHKREWFKSVDNGRALGNWTLDHLTDLRDTLIPKHLESLRQFTYPSDAGSAETLPEAPGD